MDYTVIDIIKEICGEEDIEFNLLSKDWVIMLKKNDTVKFIIGNKFDLNNHATALIFDDKYATYDVLNKLNIKVVEHSIMFKNDDYKICHDCFYKYNKDIVIKVNNGSCGNGVYHIINENEIDPLLDKLFLKNYSIGICPFYDIKCEYRLIVLNNECSLLYGKKRPVIYGDGKSSIKDLLLNFNPYYFKNVENKELDRILKENEKYEYSWQFNLSKGSIPFEIEDEYLKNRLLNFCNQITNKIDLNFCSLDIIDTSNGLFVMEINSGIMMKNYIQIVNNGKALAKQIYKNAIKSMFNM